MIILLFIIFLTIFIISIIFMDKNSKARKDTTVWVASLIISSFATIICLFVTLGYTASVVKSKYIVEKITMYEQQNKQIEEQIDTVVKQYQEY